MEPMLTSTVKTERGRQTDSASICQLALIIINTYIYNTVKVNTTNILNHIFTITRASDNEKNPNQNKTSKNMQQITMANKIIIGMLLMYYTKW